MKKLQFSNKEGVIELDEKSAGGSFAYSILLNNGAVEAKAKPKRKANLKKPAKQKRNNALQQITFFYKRPVHAQPSALMATII